MLDIGRRRLMKSVFGFSLLSLFPAAIPLSRSDSRASDQLVMVDGWVLLRSDLDAG